MDGSRPGVGDDDDDGNDDTHDDRSVGDVHDFDFPLLEGCNSGSSARRR